ncbi:unnamed protein product [Darwinula stevensoni]|uniref:Uncharacterized protein n=1 Tax=Darwinula stevensoni TaxID=69355 RepID=A0A7R9ADE5_9CRUS|nr:unnamed protein product [Darwinula stevensoni]CAG0901011.1 unnamed protein product [Darwinula stevensoni]
MRFRGFVSKQSSRLGSLEGFLNVLRAVLHADEVPSLNAGAIWPSGGHQSIEVDSVAFEVSRRAMPSFWIRGCTSLHADEEGEGCHPSDPLWSFESLFYSGHRHWPFLNLSMADGTDGAILAIYTMMEVDVGNTAIMQFLRILTPQNAQMSRESSVTLTGCAMELRARHSASRGRFCNGLGQDYRTPLVFEPEKMKVSADVYRKSILEDCLVL